MSNFLMGAKTLDCFCYKFTGSLVSSISPKLPEAPPCYSASVQIQCAVDDFFSRTGA
jgi:hypothetical protein